MGFATTFIIIKIINPVQYLGIPSRVEYSLTENDLRLIPTLKSFKDWSKEQIIIREEILNT
ncbi:MAG TPA: winged helix-turn-helix transcriptional regulator [Clostridium sp.]